MFEPITKMLGLPTKAAKSGTAVPFVDFALIDNDPAQRRSFEEQFKELTRNHRKYRLSLFGSGDNFVDAHQECDFAVVVVDLNLTAQGIDGWTVIQNILEYDEKPVIIIATGDRSVQKNLKVLDCVMFKPYRIKHVFRVWKKYQNEIHKNIFQVQWMMSETSKKQLKYG